MKQHCFFSFIYTLSKSNLTFIAMSACLNIFILADGAIRPVFSNFNQAVAIPHASMAITISGSITEQNELCTTLESLLQQDYHDWHLACSLSVNSNFNNSNALEETKLAIWDKLKQTTGLSDRKLHEKMTLTVGEENTCSLYKLWSVYSGDTTIVHLRPGDVFIHDHALTTLAQTCNASDTLLTYGRYLKNNAVNGYKIDKAWTESKLRLQFFGKEVPGYPLVFKAKLFRLIKVEDLFCGSTFFTFTTPEAYWYPLLEISRDSSAFIEEPLVICKQQEARSRKDTFALQSVVQAKPYPALDTHAIHTLGDDASDSVLRAHAQNGQILILAYSKDRPLQLYAFLESLHKHISGSYTTTVIYYATNTNYNKAYQEVAQEYRNVKFIAQHEASCDFKTITLKEMYEHSQSDYILFAVDDLIIRSPVTLSTCIYFLEKTRATSFHLRLGKNITYNYMRNKEAVQPPLYEIGEDVLLWKSNGSSGGWHYPYSLDMSLYRKKDIKRALENLVYQTPNKLEEQWALSVKRSHVNLCFKESTTINVPLNVVQKDCPENRHMNLYSPEELLGLFNSNLKIDIEPWYSLRPKAPHMPLTPRFITRTVR